MRSSKGRLIEHSRRGTTTVEVALTLPILLIVIFAGWEFSRINVIRNSMDNAAYEAARESMLPGATVAEIRAKGQAVLDAVGIEGAVIDVHPTVIVADTPEVSIDVRVPVSKNSLGVAKFMSSGDMTSNCTLSRELQPGNF